MQQESPRDLKHLAIHKLVSEGFLVFNNVGAKDTIDLVIGVPKSGELRIAGMRIKASSYLENRGVGIFLKQKQNISLSVALVQELRLWSDAWLSLLGKAL